MARGNAGTCSRAAPPGEARADLVTDVIAAWDALEWSTLGLAIATAFLAVFALWQLVVSVRTEARRALPIAIVHQEGGRIEYDTFQVYLTNEGVGAAFNVRFGVSLDGLEYVAGEGRGHRALVPAGGRVPEAPPATIAVKASLAPYALQKGGPDVDRRALFFARYEDARGKTRETRNPADPTADFRIGRPPRFLKRHERRQAEKRAKADMSVNERLIAESGQLQQPPPPAADD